MNDEIKEILKEMKFLQEKKIKFYSLDINQSKLLLDYITNLQQENDYYFKKNNELSTLNTSLRSDRDNYKSRIEKAVEYIKESHEQDFMWLPIFEKELLNILNGKE